MPVYRMTYRQYEGDVRPTFRWWTIVKQEIRILVAQRVSLLLFLLPFLHIAFRLLQVVAFDTLRSDPNNPIAIALRSATMFSVTPTMFLDFIRIQAPLVFLITIHAGAGMICNDFRNNLIEVLFSKPLTWRDYVLGKTMSLVVIGLALTAAPGVLLLILHNLLVPGLKTLRETYWVFLPIILFSLTIVLPAALGVLACSALVKSTRFAGIAVFMLLFGNLAMGTLLPQLLNNRNYLIVAFPMAINRLGEFLFHERKGLFDLSWGWCAGYVMVVCVVSLWIVCRKVRRAEVAA